MEPDFMLPIHFEDKDLEFPARILNFGYTVKLEVMVDGTSITFEPDEERNWRAVLGFEDLVNGKKASKDLLEAIAKVIEEITKQ